jgi:hypothetical protein
MEECAENIFIQNSKIYAQSTDTFKANSIVKAHKALLTLQKKCLPSKITNSTKQKSLLFRKLFCCLCKQSITVKSHGQ